MEYLGFEIKNFKGIENAVVDLESAPNGNVYTLVGLNESGKTTVLEAVSFFNREDIHLESLYDEETAKLDLNEIVPQKKSANFNDTIEITASLKLSDTDKDELCKYAKNNFDFYINRDAIEDEVKISRTKHYKNSLYTNSTFSPYITLVGTSGRRGRKEKSLRSVNSESYWDLLRHMMTSLPPILYFPTSLFDFPSKIYLNIPEENDEKINIYYKSIIQDILDALGENLNINEHVVDRALNGGKFNTKNLDKVLTKMSALVSSNIFGRWNDIFDSKKTNKKEIRIEYGTAAHKSINKDTNEEKIEQIVYLEFSIKDGDSIYYLSERSLGFRWFFCFLLFTQFRTYRKEKNRVLFLFDEPASNLHSKAQTQLLKSFSKITKNGGKIIYSTHSHYMINPQWLENTFIVKNEGLSYEGEDEYDYTSKDTDISVIKYRSFVGQNPDDETYFKPILDTLDYVPSILENIPNVIMMEGKNDYYMVKYFERELGINNKVNILPGVGATKLDSIISMYLGWGRKFVIVLDGDKAGLSAKEKYINEWLLKKDIVFTLGDVSDDWEGYKIEKLFTSDDIKSLKEKVYPDKIGDGLNKKEICRALQELLATDDSVEFSTSTKDNFKELIEFFQKALDNLSE